MYAVVGCTECGNMWLLRDPVTNDTAKCTRCGRRHRTTKLKRLYESEDHDAARQARAALLANKHGTAEAFANVDHVAELERAVDEASGDDREYLERSGIDADAVAAAGSRAEGGDSRTRSRDAIVRDAVDEVEPATEAAIVAYATDHGVPADAAKSILTTLTRHGELLESHGRYRTV